MPFYLFTESYGCPCNSILKNTYLTSENAGTMNKLRYESYVLEVHFV